MVFLTRLYCIESVTISGNIIDVSQNPLPGSNVILVNTTYGGAADVDGFYSLVVPVDFIANNTALIKASFIGYRSTADTIRFTGQKEIRVDFVLSQDVLGLEAVVVTGLGGLEEKKKLGVLIESVKPEAAQKSGETNIITALRGNVPFCNAYPTKNIFESIVSPNRHLEISVALICSSSTVSFFIKLAVREVL